MKLILIFLFFLNISFAYELKEISDFAKDICGEIKTAGKQEGYRLNLEGKFDPKLLSKLGIKINSSGQYSQYNKKYDGLSLEDIPDQLKDIRSCKMYILDKFSLQNKSQSSTFQKKTNFICERKNLRVMQKNTYAAISKTYYDIMKDAIKNSKSELLAEMIEDGKVVKLKKMTRVCFIRNEFYWYRTKIKIDGFNNFDYWVDDRKVEQLN